MLGIVVLRGVILMVNFNNSQRLGLDLDKHIALDAGAGTGKTTVMAERYVQHLLANDQRATHMTPPGPRVPLSGHGSLRAPKKERTEIEDWNGLLPSEVVAITFTRKAAAELKARIRHRLAQSRAQPPKEEDIEGIFDPRLRDDADVEMLLSSLDEAPISTIDAFLHRLVRPYIDTVTLHSASDQVPEERAPLMLRDTMHAVWRIRTTDDASDAGVLSHQHEFIQSRNRLVTRLGGQEPAEVVLNGLLNTSLFVEQSHRSMIQRAQDLGLSWNGRGPAPVSLLLDMVAQPIASELPGFINRFAPLLRNWVSLFLPHTGQCSEPIEEEHDTVLTRFNHLARLVSTPIPERPADQLVWMWKAMIGMAGSSGLSKTPPTFFPRNNLPSTDKWQGGLLAKGKVKGMKGTDKDALFANSVSLQGDLKQELQSPLGILIRLLAESAFLLNPGDGYDGMPLDCPLRLAPLPPSIGPTPVEGGTYVSADLQMEILSDLITVHRGCHQILARRKSLEGMHDFDDIQRFAADLLLARCPDVCRHRYPPEVIDALDGLGDNPWSDEHISRALTLLNDQSELQDDLHRRFAVLAELRRQFRAFIIDEYQDTNPSHYRLLARLWGRRSRHADDPPRPKGYWDPTVCIVGDMKQSIYRFRQAEVSVMRRAVAAVRDCNRIEADESSLLHLRKDGEGRDPRPVGAGGETGSYTNEHGAGTSAPHSYVSYAWEDGETTSTITGERLERRQEGHIDLTSNHRTRPNLMESMNDIFDEVFSPRHHALPGDWHAEAQRLHPARVTEEQGVLEWLLPIQGALQHASYDLDVPLNTFENPNASNVQLEHELLATRLHSLLNGEGSRVWNSVEAVWEEVAETGPEVRPEDVMILINSRRHLPDLLERLRARGIPVMADRQGLLLMQPVVQPLMAVLELLAHPYSRKAGIELARSAVVGMNESQVHAAFYRLADEHTAWDALLGHAPNDAIEALLQHLQHLASLGAIYDVMDAVLDHSDLLVAFSDDSQRQHAEAWLGMIHSIGNETGHSVTAIYRRLNELIGLEKRGPQAISKPTKAAVQIMTIHGAKGLQAPVVAVSGIFTAGMADVTTSVKDNVLVTPQVVAGRIQPWHAHERPVDGLWAFASEMNTAQDKAELRRKFYVALTRVKDRLIITGRPSSTSTFDAESGALSLVVKPDPRTMGRMWVEGLRRASWRAGDEHSPWLLSGDYGASSLPPYASSKVPVALNPALLLTNNPLGENGVPGMRLYHHPDCFHQTTPPSPQQRLRMLEAHLDQSTLNESDNDVILQPLRETIKGAAHHLDATEACPRRYWLEHMKGWASEPFNIPNGLTKPKQKRWPLPTEFGLMMHRIVEIGLRNPLQFSKDTPKLPRDWHHENDGTLASETTVGRVMAEFGYGETQRKDSTEYRWRERMLHLSSLIDTGLLGRWVAGEPLHGFIVEAVRTELPFIHSYPVSVDSFKRSRFSPNGPVEQATVERVDMNFNGRADLVLALADENGQGCLQVVDLKTKGCMAPFNPDLREKGHALQEVGPETTNPFPETDAEAEILYEHRLQLTLYSVALEAIEQLKPKEEQRRVLPPALLLGANGRIVQMTEEEFLAAKADLEQHLHWRTMMHLTNGSEEPERLESGSTVCQGCPYYKGDVRRCGPKGEQLGFIDDAEA
jgi:ATP-dependent exoDNAse (exonuclease V) beta subunit